MDLPEDSDTSDDDYVPEGCNAELPSEEELDGDDEDPLPEAEDLGKRGQKRQKKGKKSRKKIKNLKASETVSEETPENKEPSEEDKKKKADALWADFMKDTGFKSKAERGQETNNSKTEAIKLKTQESQVKVNKPPEKVKVTQIFEFAGETVKVEKEVAVNSAEARLLNKPSSSEGEAPKTNSRGHGGMSSVLSQLGKKSKINTLEKSKLDWEKFKKEEDISEELQAYGKSKDGYLERQDFLERTDLRRFEIEKGIRNTLRTNRLDNVKM